MTQINTVSCLAFVPSLYINVVFWFIRCPSDYINTVLCIGFVPSVYITYINKSVVSGSSGVQSSYTNTVLCMMFLPYVYTNVVSGS